MYLATVSGKYTATVPPHGSLTLKLTAQAAEDGTVRACDAVAPAESGGPLYERQYVQLDCALGASIVSIERVLSSPSAIQRALHPSTVSANESTDPLCSGV